VEKINMQNSDNSKAPVSLYFNLLAKRYIGAVAKKLSHLEIDKYFYVLMVIDKYRDNITQQQLADYFRIDKASLVRILNYLSKSGMLERKVNPRDRREHLLVLTPKALEILPEIKLTYAEINQTALKGLNEEQVEVFYATLDTICSNLSALPANELFVRYENINRKQS
jgi:MarR family transcriptional regulator for hemolysin